MVNLTVYLTNLSHLVDQCSTLPKLLISSRPQATGAIRYADRTNVTSLAGSTLSTGVELVAKCMGALSGPIPGSTLVSECRTKFPSPDAFPPVGKSLSTIVTIPGELLSKALLHPEVVGENLEELDLTLVSEHLHFLRYRYDAYYERVSASILERRAADTRSTGYVTQATRPSASGSGISGGTSGTITARNSYRSGDEIAYVSSQESNTSVVERPSHTVQGTSFDYLSRPLATRPIEGDLEERLRVQDQAGIPEFVNNRRLIEEGTSGGTSHPGRWTIRSTDLHRTVSLDTRFEIPSPVEFQGEYLTVLDPRPDMTVIPARWLPTPTPAPTPNPTTDPSET